MQQQAIKTVSRGFRPTSKKKHFIDRYQKAYQNTRIYYQHGRVNGKKAVKLFFDGEEIGIRYKTDKYRHSGFDIYAYGGQDMNDAQQQREETLQKIVKKLLDQFGFTVKIEPKLGRYTPDVLAERSDLQIYLELKAYHRYNIVGDAEITQAMKYYETSRRMHGKDSRKSVLVTTGDLIRKRDSYLSHPDKKPHRYVKSFYKKHIKPRRYVDSMDKFISKMMYIHTHKKFKRNRKMGFGKMNVVFPEDIRDESIIDFMTNDEQYDVLLLDYDIVYDLLRKYGLDREAHYFKLIREARLEKLVLNRTVLKME